MDGMMHFRDILSTVGTLAKHNVQRHAYWNNLLKEFSYSHGRMVNFGKPCVFEIETTNDCPYTCIMCPRTFGMTRDVGHMDFGLFKNIIDQLQPAWQIESVGSTPRVRLLHYGEPFVYKHYADAIRYCHDKGFTVYISSNPSVWTDRKIDETLDCGLDELLVMVDGLDNETSQAIRGRAASFTRGERNILEMAKRKVERGLKTPQMTLAMIKQPRNSHQWDMFKKHWEGIEGIDGVFLAHYSTFAGDLDNLNQIAQELESKDPLQAEQAARQHLLATYPCFYPWHSVSVTWKGMVVPCCRDYDETTSLGDLTKNSLEHIWNDAPMRKLRGEFVSGEVITPLCMNCKEPSLEIGLPGRHYVPARWMRSMKVGPMHQTPAPASAPAAGGGDLVQIDANLATRNLEGSQNSNRDNDHVHAETRR